MNPGYIEIGPWQLLLAVSFIVLAQGLSYVHKLGLNRDLSVGTLRTFGQLFLLGYALRYIFAANLFIVVAAVFTVMMVMAGHVIRGRVKERDVEWRVPLGLSMLLSYSIVSFVVLAVVVQAKPWWRPDYFIPIAGMIIGNSMNALAISLDRLFADLRSRRAEVEMKLAHGADYREASQDMVRAAIRAGMIPSI
ncbi:MAG: ABC transporter permease, partial [Proteobacteria bacterium]|nr:ABC transporter permease [Pseudomonadota bacterium]